MRSHKSCKIIEGCLMWSILRDKFDLCLDRYVLRAISNFFASYPLSLFGESYPERCICFPCPRDRNVWLINSIRGLCS